VHYDVFDVTLSVHPHRAGWDTSPMLCQLSSEAKSVRVCGISELSLVPSIPMCSMIMILIFACVFDVMYSGEYNVFDVTLSVYGAKSLAQKWISE
jgi:hypothetical protein